MIETNRTAEKEFVQQPLDPKPELRPEERLLFDVLKDWSSIVVCGGWVRDTMLGAKPNDLDFLVSADEFDRLNIGILTKLLYICPKQQLKFIKLDTRAVPGTPYGAGMLQCTFKFEVLGEQGTPNQPRELSFDIKSMFKGETLRDEAKYRDFKMNCLFYDFRTNMVIGRKEDFDDIRERRISAAIDRETTLRDPVRLLRAIRFKNKLGLTIAGGFDFDMHYYSRVNKLRAQDPKHTRFHHKRKVALEYHKMFANCKDKNTIIAMVKDIFTYRLHTGPIESDLLEPEAFSNIFAKHYDQTYSALIRWTGWDCKGEERCCLAIGLIISVALVATNEMLSLEEPDRLLQTFEAFFQEHEKPRASDLLEKFLSTWPNPENPRLELTSYMWHILSNFGSNFTEAFLESNQNSDNSDDGYYEEEPPYYFVPKKRKPKSYHGRTLESLEKDPDFWLDFYGVDDPQYWMYGSVKDWTPEQFAYADHVNMGGFSF